MYNLQKNCPQMSFPGRREAPNILHGGKMLAPHFKDEIASLHKWPFLACFWPFLEQFFFVMTHIYGQTKYILQKNCPHISFPCCREAPNILHPLLKRPHRLLNWQIQVTRVSWVGQSTSCDYDKWLVDCPAQLTLVTWICQFCSMTNTSENTAENLLTNEWMMAIKMVSHRSDDGICTGHARVVLPK